MNKNTKAIELIRRYKCAFTNIYVLFIVLVHYSNLKATYIFRDANTPLAGQTNKLVMYLCYADLFYSRVCVKGAKFDAIAFSIYFKSYPDVGYTRNARCPFWLRGGEGSNSCSTKYLPRQYS